MTWWQWGIALTVGWLVFWLVYGQVRHSTFTRKRPNRKY